MAIETGVVEKIEMNGEMIDGESEGDDSLRFPMMDGLKSSESILWSK